MPLGVPALTDGEYVVDDGHVNLLGGRWRSGTLSTAGVLGRDESGNLSPAQLLGIGDGLDRVSLGVLQAERMVDQLDEVSVEIVHVRVVLAGVLAAPLMRIGAADVEPGARGRRPHVLDAQLVQASEHGVPVVHLQGEMAGRDGGRPRGLGEVDLAVSDAQLELPLVERRASVQELGAQHLRVPVPGPLSIADLDVDVVNQLDPEHRMTSMARGDPSRAPSRCILTIRPEYGSMLAIQSRLHW